MQTAKIKEDGKPEYEAQIEDFDPAGRKQGSFVATQFGEGDRKLSVPSGVFTLTLDGKAYRCQTLIATHFSVADEFGAVSRESAAAGR